MNKERKEHSNLNTEVHDISVATLTSVSGVRPKAFGDNLHSSPKFLAKSMPYLHQSIRVNNVKDARAAATNETPMALPATVNSTRRLVSATAFDTAAQEATALGPVLDAVALTLYKQSSEAKEMGQVVGRYEVALRSAIGLASSRGDTYER